MRTGGFAIYAHGGYSQAIYADFVQKHVSAVELLQFGVYRGIELAGWYDMLNIGYRFPCVGASDYPACRKLGDCQTYVWLGRSRAISPAGSRRCGQGRSFVTNGPLLLLEVEGDRPGGIIRLSGTGPHRVRVSVRVISHVAPVQTVQIDRRGQGCRGAEGAARESNRAGGSSSIGRSSCDRLVVDCRAGVRRGSLGCARRRGAHESGVRRHRREGPVQPRLARSSDRASRRADGRSTASGASRRRPACWMIFRSRATSCCGSARPAGCRPAAFPTTGSTTIRRRPIDPSRRTHRDEELSEFLRTAAGNAAC